MSSSGLKRVERARKSVLYGQHLASEISKFKQRAPRLSVHMKFGRYNNRMTLNAGKTAAVSALNNDGQRRAGEDEGGRRVSRKRGFRRTIMKKRTTEGGSSPTTTTADNDDDEEEGGEEEEEEEEEEKEEAKVTKKRAFAPPPSPRKMKLSVEWTKACEEARNNTPHNVASLRKLFDGYGRIRDISVCRKGSRRAVVIYRSEAACARASVGDFKYETVNIIEEPCRKVNVAWGWEIGVSSVMLHRLLAQYGQIKKIQLLKKGGRAVVTFARQESAVAAANAEHRDIDVRWHVPHRHNHDEEELRRETKISVVPKEQLFLVEFYETTGGKNWGNNEGWSDPENDDVRTWFGVTVERGHLTRLELPANNLTGEIPQTIGNCAFLTTVRLQHNLLQGPIPETFGNLKHLRCLFLQGNWLQCGHHIPDFLRGLGRLRMLGLKSRRGVGDMFILQQNPRREEKIEERKRGMTARHDTVLA